MDTLKNAAVRRFKGICKERGIKPNAFANLAGITPSTIYSFLDENRQNVQLRTIKIICDGLNITLGEFFSTDDFDSLEQEIK